MPKIYVDNNTAATPSQKAIHEMLPLLSEHWGYSGQPHDIGQRQFPAMEEAYRSIYSFSGAPEEQNFIFTSSGSEAICQALWSGYYDRMLPTGKNQFVSVSTEDAAILLSIHRFEEMGAVGKFASINSSGIVTAETIGDLITPRTAMVSLSWANALTGVIQPIAEISDLCKERGILFHVDATQVLGKLFFEWEDIDADFLTFNGLPIHSPVPCGGVFWKNELKSSPLIVGGAEQAGHRGGEVGIAALAAMGVCAKEADENRDLLCLETARLRGRFEEKIKKEVTGAEVFFQQVDRLPHVSAIGFPGVASEALLYTLNEKGVYATVGGGNCQKLSIILEACGIDPILSQCALSFSFSRETTESDIDELVSIVSESIENLRRASNGLQIGDAK